MLENLMRWVRIRGLTEGKMQKGRVEGLPNDVRDGAPRPQDYGFAANPVDGEGFKLEIGGHTIIIRMDRTAERPELAPYEVAMWHKEGHMVKLKAGRVIEMIGDSLVLNMSASVAINSPALTHNGKNVGDTHTHLLPGGSSSLPPT